MAHDANKQTAQYAPLPVWARKSTVQDLTGTPDKFLYQFAANNPADVRKFGSGGKNGTLIFRVAAVLDAVENVGRATA